ncbi:(d)CMP kinase [Pseudodesulfovibrio pelocollis]|uniref:(d)CMP kinase n=1 Tax=Pseudodesulfovibrio pelocollis TaxID=3051432 RepID=UPI00255AA32C|nr:(d)CMP kinase [Pseudodesulfovibrio sp. SB368]
MADPLIVTIDGPAGVGKSTMAKRLARALSIPYLDTGAMFRAVALRLGDGAWERGEADLASALAGMEFSLSGVGEDSVLSLDGAPIGDEVRTEQVAMWASNLATLPVVRASLKAAQQTLGKRFSLVAEGRDMGSVVFPTARRKFFLDATADERARRRLRQLADMGKTADFDDLREQIARRDHQDRNRAEAPLRPAPDAVIIDTTSLAIDEVFAALVRGVRG